MTYAIISCEVHTLEGIYKAKELYSSERFQKVLTIAQSKASKIFILSPSQGLIDINDPAASCSMNIGDLTPEEYFTWLEAIEESIRVHIPRGSEIHFFCYQDYTKHLIPNIEGEYHIIEHSPEPTEDDVRQAIASEPQ